MKGGIIERKSLRPGLDVRCRPTFDPEHWRDCEIIYVHPALRFVVVEYNLDKRDSDGLLHRRRPREAVLPGQVARGKRWRSS